MADVGWKPYKKVSKQKQKKVKKLTDPVVSLVPRLQLEPRLTHTSPSKSSKVNDQLSSIEKDKKLVVILSRNTVTEYFEKKHAHFDEERESFTLRKALSYVNPKATNSNMVPNHSPQDIDFDISSVDVDSFSPQDKAGKKSALNSFKSKRKQHIRKGILWKDSELKYLAHGLQAHGFADLDKVAAFVKTKNENEIREYIKPLITDARNNNTDNTGSSQKHAGRPANSWHTVSHENIQNWPNVRKWRRLAYEQMLPYTRTKDYSKQVIKALCKKFYEEEEEPSDPQVINVKLIYKYLMDCISGSLPPQLPPKESALVLDMLRETRLIPIAYDFEEERNFLRNYKTSTKFKPFEVKDEFKKRFKKALDSDAVTPDTVPVPEPIFVNLSRHKRLVQSFNPLVVPVWMPQKEQEHLEKYHDESNVYVD